MLNDSGSTPGPSHPPQQDQDYSSSFHHAYVRITQQPAQKSLRFRYECEGRSAGAITGVDSTSESKTYPTIKIVGYKGPAVVVVSCVTKDEPYRVHPHNLVGKNGCKKGICQVKFNSESMCYTFTNLGIQCVRRREVEAVLKMKEEIGVDPFKNGFDHRNQPSEIELNAVRLCFQVFLPKNNRFSHPLRPVVSDIIYDKKAMSDLMICKMSHCSASVAGGQEVILLCEKVTKDGLKIKFSDNPGDPNSWVAYGDFQHTDVHKQVAITFRTPKYKTLRIAEPVQVYIQLMRNSDTSEARPFEMLPIEGEPVVKRKRLEYDGNFELLRKMQQPTRDVASADPVVAQFNMYSNQQPKFKRKTKGLIVFPTDQAPDYGVQQPGIEPPYMSNIVMNINHQPQMQDMLPGPSEGRSPQFHQNISLQEEAGNYWNIYPDGGTTLQQATYEPMENQSPTTSTMNTSEIVSLIDANMETNEMTDSMTRLRIKFIDELLSKADDNNRNDI